MSTFGVRADEEVTVFEAELEGSDVIQRLQETGADLSDVAFWLPNAEATERLDALAGVIARLLDHYDVET